ncbi:hypothetical protein GTW43_13445 [Streptomyces sp. SID5785]|uniref:HAD family hydrolase n=1 Tax=Streptomyces sp. SID5785 TaxID=2690309 RepID=UPI001361D0E5|nr:HAD family hydrolase [Streptomyces sp. SID5785]MZD06087.1 hypothetical protein [Streptomyces sp. SID5785]
MTSRAAVLDVGDSVWDMKAARRAGVTPMAVLSGGVCGSALEAAGAAQVYRDTADLLSGLDSSPFGRAQDERSAGSTSLR